MVPKYLDKASWPFVGMIRSYFPGLGGGAAGGSGTLIHPRVVLTAGHVVYDPSRGGYSSRADVELGSGALTASSAVFRTTGPWVEVDSLRLNPISAYDIGAILLPSPVDPADAPAVDYAVTPGPNLGGMEINVVGFPVQPDVYGNLYGAAAFPFTMIAGLDPYRAFYPVQTLDGMSGGPVYTRAPDGRPTLRAVHTSFYNGAGSALRITAAIAALIRGWVAEVGG